TKGRIILPHMTVEYTANIKDEINAHQLLKKMNESLLSHEGLFTPQGIRSRAIQLTDYLVGHGDNTNAFVHVTLKIAPGRTEEAKKKVFDDLFQTIEEHFNDASKDKQITISLEFLELSTGGSMYHQK